MASTGFCKSSRLYFLGMLLRKYKYKTTILAKSENRSGTIIRDANSEKRIPKKSADTMLTKLLTTRGHDVVSAMNPLAIIKGKTILSSNLSARTMASTIGVRIKAAPSFANNAATTVPRRDT